MSRGDRMSEATADAEVAKRAATAKTKALRPVPPVPILPDGLDVIDRASEPAAKKPKRRARTGRELAGLMVRESRRPLVRTGISTLDDAIKLRAGNLVLVAGGTGSGKSSLALQIGRHHAIHTGPTLVLSAEMGGAECGGRLVGQAEEVSWGDALSLSLGYERTVAALDIERLRILSNDGCDDDCAPDCPGHRTANLVDAGDELAELCAEYEGQTALVIVDYVQLLALTAVGRDMRERVAITTEELRCFAQRTHAVVLVLVQVSRPAQQQLRAGELIGAEALGVGAESSQLERAAHVLLVLGGRADREDGTSTIDLSAAKVRAARSDVVITLRADYTHGRFAAAGDARTATEVRAERNAASGNARQGAAALAMAARAGRATQPVSRSELREAAAVRGTTADAAIAALLGSGELVEVRHRRRGMRSGEWCLWTPDRARAAGIDLVSDPIAEVTP